MISLYVRLQSFLVRSQKTAERLRRTLLHVAAGGAFGGVFSSFVLGAKAAESLASSLAFAFSAFIAAWAQNTINDRAASRDPDSDPRV